MTRANTRHLILLSGCLLLAFRLRFYQLQGNSLWEDEILTAIQAPLPVADMLQWTAGDIHPPGYYLVVGGAAQIFGWAARPPSGTTDWLWRLPSSIAGVLAVALTFRLGAAWLGRRVGITGALLLAVSPVAIRYSQEARMHELFLLTALLSTWALTRALRESLDRLRWRWWLGYAMATAASLYTVYLGFVVLMVQAGWVIADVVVRREKPAGRRLAIWWAVSVVLAMGLYTPWWPVVAGILRQRIVLRGVESGSGVSAPLTFAAGAITSLGPRAAWAAWLWLALWAIGLADVGRTRAPLAVLGGLWLLLPVVFSAASGDPRAQHMRYAFLLPVYLIFVAAGAAAVVRLMPHWRRRRRSRLQRDVVPLSPQPSRFKRDLQTRVASVAALAFIRRRSRFQRDIVPDPRQPSRSKRDLRIRVASVAALAFISVLGLPAYYEQARTGWRAAATYLNQHTRPGDVIVYDPLFDAGRYLDYYYDGPAELAAPAVLVASLPQRLPGMRASGGRVWAVTRFLPRPVAAMRPIGFPGLVISEPVVPVYEPEVLTAAVIDLVQQAVAAAPEWAARMSAQGIMDPDPHVARAAAYLFLGDALRAAGRLPEAIAAYEAVVADDPDPAAGYVTLAEAYQAAGRDQAAVHAYQQAVARAPKWQGVSAEAASTLAQAGRWAEAAAAYQAIVVSRGNAE